MRQNNRLLICLVIFLVSLIAVYAENNFTIEYSPDIGNITMIGSVLYLDDPEVIEEILSNWKKNKELPKEVMPQIFDMILAKCNTKSLILADDVNLPSPIRLPRVKKQDSK